MHNKDFSKFNNFKKIYIFPYSNCSKFLASKIKKKIIFVDNFSAIKSNLIRPNKIIDKRDNIIIFTDTNKNLGNKLSKIKKISINIKDPDAIKNITDLDKLKIKEKRLSKLFLKFNTDKGKYFKNFGFKDKAHNYSKFYVRNLSYLKEKKINILEIGTYRGDAAAAFISYFKKSNLVTIDNTKKLRFKSKRIKFYKLDYLNKIQQKKFTQKYKNFFDIIIDDGGHYKSHNIKNLKNFFTCLKKKSFYIIEDISYYPPNIDDAKKELKMIKILEKLNLKKYFPSNLLNKKIQNLLMKNIDYLKLYQGDWTKNGRNISNIAFIKTK